MSDAFDRELLSARIDDELTGDERSELQKQLEQSDDLQTELSGLQELSELLRDLPPIGAPAGFREEILHLAEQRSLIASPAPPIRSGRLRRWSYIGSSAAAVLLVAFVVIHFTGDRPASSRTENRVASSSDVAPAASYPVADAGDPRFAAVPVDELALPSALSSGAPMAESDAAAAVASTAVADDTVELTSSRQTLVFGDELRDADIGEVVEAMDTSGNRVVVVRLTVVDRRLGLESLEVLLTRNEIVADSAYDAEPRVDGESGSDELLAVMVEATPDQLARALREMNNDDQFRRLQVEPLQVALAARLADLMDAESHTLHDPGDRLLADTGEQPQARIAQRDTRPSPAAAFEAEESLADSPAAAISPDGPLARSDEETAPPASVSSFRRVYRTPHDFREGPNAGSFAERSTGRGAIQILILLEPDDSPALPDVEDGPQRIPIRNPRGGTRADGEL